MVGPASSPSSTTRAKWTPRPPASRTLVKPALRAAPRFLDARAAATATGRRIDSCISRVMSPVK